MTVSEFLSHIKHKNLYIDIAEYQTENLKFSGTLGVYQNFYKKMLYQDREIIQIQPRGNYLIIYIEGDY